MTKRREKRMRIAAVVAMFALVAAADRCPAQLVSVQCCSEQGDFENITDCVGGTNVLVRPALCRPAATCVLGFGPDASFMDGLCAPLQGIPIFDRGFCSSWSDDSIPVVQQCVAIPNADITMFEVYDDDQDGDLDVADLAMFKQVYAGVPKLTQSDAAVVAVDCCIHDAVLPQIGECLSGPGVTTQPPGCALRPACVTGFSAPLETGDWLYRVCALTPVPPASDTSHCVSWQSSGEPVVFECPTVPTLAPSFFVLADTDADVDVDLRDFAVMQREIADIK